MKKFIITCLIATLFIPNSAVLEAVTDDFTVTLTVASTDTTAPSIPTNLTAAPVTSSRIDLTWTASTDNVSVSGYQIFRDGFAIATSTGTSYSDTGLSPATTYMYTVQAFDAANNYSAQSASASATTLTEEQDEDTGPSGGSVLLLKTKALAGVNHISLEIKTNIQTRAYVTWSQGGRVVGSIESEAYRTLRTIEIPDLLENTPYSIRVEVVDQINRTKVETFLVKTARGEPLENPSNFRAISKREGIALSWKNPDDPNFKNVRVMRSEGTFPSHPYDGTLIYEGDAQSFLDVYVREGERYGYTIFARDEKGRFSSGAVAMARAWSRIPLGDGGLVIEPPATTTLTFDLLTIYQRGEKVPALNGEYIIDTAAPFTVSFEGSNLPKVLKTILVSLRDPRDPDLMFSFLLRATDIEGRYEARVGALEEEGDYPLNLSLLNLKSQAIDALDGSVRAITFSDYGVPVAGTSERWFANLDLLILFGLMLLFFLLLVLLIVFLAIREWEKRRRRRPQTA